jgi:hypothetical protein
VWLGEAPADIPRLKTLLAAYPSDEMICRRVSARVGNVKNNDPSRSSRLPRRKHSFRSSGDRQPGRSSIDPV